VSSSSSTASTFCSNFLQLKDTWKIAKKIPWQGPCGVEMTFLRDIGRYVGEDDASWDSRIWSASERAAQEGGEFHTIMNMWGLFKNQSNKKKIVPSFSVASDPGCAEISSKRFLGWSEVEQWTKFVRIAASLVGCVPRILDCPSSSGMGHIHVGKITDEEVTWMMRDMMMRPYLSWNFLPSKYSGWGSAEPLVKWFILKPLLRKIVKKRVLDDSDVPKYKNEIRSVRSHDSIIYDVFNRRANVEEKNAFLPVVKHYFIRWSEFYKTVEFRGFEAALNDDEQEEHFAFVHAYIRYVRQKMKDGIPPGDIEFTNTKEAIHFLSSFGIYDACDEFMNFIEELGLPMERYQHYPIDNLATWWGSGTKDRLNLRGFNKVYSMG
jgi:hypothetical protein